MTAKTGDIDTIDLTRALIRCPSVTPQDAGALDVLQAALERLGFACHRLAFGGADGTDRVDNLYARLGMAAPNFCFAGHTDVVPIGHRDDWAADPFSAEIRDGHVYGRGAADMKGAIAAFVAAVGGFLAARNGTFDGSISLLITGDEEGPAVNGTAKVLDWLHQRGETIDMCLVGEPTNPHRMGEMIKVGRRGSLNGLLTVEGTKGHVAYPEKADNPVPRLIALVSALTAAELDDGSAYFQPSNLEITSIDVGNTASNVIPPRAWARFNIRFNDRHSGASLDRWLRETLDKAADGAAYKLEIEVSGESFYTPPGALSEAVAAAAEDVLGRRPAFGTSGGTSDARFIRKFCPVAEFGLVGETMHKVDERIAIADLEALTRVYRGVLGRLFPETP
ncbi:MAG: succinyl-diaminopimelate desuccinylase [Alphaproteobacteria bacterium]|nr:succinyl-diaminopimelate desuccinylase [Alphaproteobacteria bacterium]